MRKRLTLWLLLVVGLVVSNARPYRRQRSSSCIGCDEECREPCFVRIHGECYLDLAKCPPGSELEQTLTHPLPYVDYPLPIEPMPTPMPTPPSVYVDTSLDESDLSADPRRPEGDLDPAPFREQRQPALDS